MLMILILIEREITEYESYFSFITYSDLKSHLFSISKDVAVLYKISVVNLLKLK